MFSSADENPWDGYDSALDDELALEEESTSEDEAGARIGEKAKDAALYRVRASFYHPDIDAHEQQMRANAVADITDDMPGCSTPVVARTAANAGRPPFFCAGNFGSKIQADITAASTGQDEAKHVSALDSLPGSWGGETLVSSIKDHQMEDEELSAHTGDGTWTGIWSDRLLRVEWPGGRGLPLPYTLIPQDSPLLKLPTEGLAAHAIEVLGMSEHGAQLFAATVRKKQQGQEMVVEEARLMSPVEARDHLSQHGLRPDTLAVEALETLTVAATTALLAGLGGVDDTTRLGRNGTSAS